METISEQLKAQLLNIADGLNAITSIKSAKAFVQKHHMTKKEATRVAEMLIRSFVAIH